jgi:hypothetical protein
MGVRTPSRRKRGSLENLRMLAFGSSGIVSFLILDEDREVLVLQIQWAG